MANLTLIIGSIIGWFIIVVIIFKVFCDRKRELEMIRDIRKDIRSVKDEIKTLK